MRLRLAVLASLLTVLVAVVGPGGASAAPRHNHGLTINAVPRHIIAGEGVLIYGRLQGGDSAHQLIRLYHRIAPRSFYSLVGTTHTDAQGYFEFVRAEGVVDTNRAWFVRGPDRTHSRTVYERVDSLVSLAAGDTSPSTLQRVMFTGHVFPNHRFQRVLLQEQVGSDDWRTIKTGFTGGGSNFFISYRWRTPGNHVVRAVFRGDRRNTRGSSDVVELTIQQKQITGFTITSSQQRIVYGSSAKIAGVLDQPGATTPDGGIPVTLMARLPGQSRWQAVTDTKTATDGSYSFQVTPGANTFYRVQVTLSAHRHTAVLFEGVRDQLSASASATTGTSGSTVSFTGTVLPGHSGDVVYLQRLGKDGDWHTVAPAPTNGSGAYSIPWTLGDPGTDTFRTRVLASRLNLGAWSSPTAITITAPPAQSLTPAS